MIGAPTEIGMHEVSGPSTPAQVDAMAWIFTHDPELTRLLAELREIEVELLAAEQAIPEHVRDTDTVEADVLGYLDDEGKKPCQVRAEIRASIRAFTAQYRPLAAYGKLILRRRDVNAAIDARKEQLSAPAPN